LIVVTAEKASASEFDEHRRLVALSTQAEHIVAERSGHWVQLDRPDLVVDAVHRLIQKHRHSEELTQV
jgi:pimeloyl-ACP methyl ester carboxylesterase